MPYAAKAKAQQFTRRKPNLMKKADQLNEEDRSWLMILDNVDNAQLFFPSVGSDSPLATVTASESYNIYQERAGDVANTTLNSLSLLGSVLRNQGKYEAAEEMNRRALEGREKVRPFSISEPQ